jgi:hypothetical protein
LDGGINVFGYVGGGPLYWADPEGLKIVGFFILRPEIRDFNITVSANEQFWVNGDLHIQVEVSGAAKVSFVAGCTETCTGEYWEESFSVDTSSSYVGHAVVPVPCGVVAFVVVQRYGGIYGKGANMACGIVLARSFSTVAGVAYREVYRAINERLLPIALYYSELGATAICEGSR